MSKNHAPGIVISTLDVLLTHLILKATLQGQYDYHSHLIEEKTEDKEVKHRASPVAQWLRVCLLMQGTRVRALVWEDPTCRGAAGPVSHNC